MIILSVLYPASEGATFDWDYYRATHLPLVHRAWDSTGLQSIEVFEGVGTPQGGAAPYVCMAHLRFDDAAAMHASVGGAAAAEVFADIINFTPIVPLTQISHPG
ncbi:MAG: EthD family reductase [Sphingomonas sp.]|jgi:uncharacterized protein (TIGR02118 family)|nr:EthD family reductase [Sphingomonas sp.]